LIQGTLSTWDYEARVDPNAQYVRNLGKGVLDNIKLISRWSRFLRQPAQANSISV
jgi:choline-sulfatase